MQQVRLLESQLKQSDVRIVPPEMGVTSGSSMNIHLHFHFIMSLESEHLVKVQFLCSRVR
jgi:hypothetical protein